MSGYHTDIAGFTVPKGAQVLVKHGLLAETQALGITQSPLCQKGYWGQIDLRGQKFELIRFGAGRGISPGLPLAIRMIHLMLGSLIHSFDWKLEDGVSPEDLNMEDEFGITLQMAHPLRAVPILR